MIKPTHIEEKITSWAEFFKRLGIFLFLFFLQNALIVGLVPIELKVSAFVQGLVKAKHDRLLPIIYTLEEIVDSVFLAAAMLYFLYRFIVLIYEISCLGKNLAIK